MTACTKAMWRGVTVCEHMVPDLDAIAAGVGSGIYLRPFIVPPSGSYQTSTSASNGTHSLGGAIDFDMSSYSWDVARHVETVARSHYKLAYARTAVSGLWKQHVHVLDPNCHDLSYAAQRQFPLWQQGLNNLANNGPDTGVRTWVSKTMSLFNTRMTRPYPPQEDPLSGYTPADLEKYAAVGVLGCQVGHMKDSDGTPITVGVILDRLYSSMNDLADKVAALQAAVDALPKAPGA